MTKYKRILYIALCTLVLVSSMGVFAFASSGDIISFSDEASFVHMPVLGKAINTVTTQDVLDYGTEFKTSYYLLTCYAEPYASTTFAQGAYGCYYMNGNDVWFAIMLSAPSTPSIASMNTIFNTISQQSYTTAKYSNNSSPTNQVFTYKASAAQNDLYLALDAFDSWDDALNTFDQFVSAGYPTSVGEVIPFTISPGYALVVSGPCEILERNYSISGSWDFVRVSGTDYRVNGSVNRLFDSVNIRDGYSPDQGFSRDQMIQWSAANANSQGVASMYSFSSNSVISVLSDECYVITYPEYLGIESVTGDDTVHFKNSVSFNGSLYVQYSSSRPSFRQVALETVETWVGRTYSMYNVFRPNVYDETGEITTDGSGDPVVVFPDGPSGGGNTGQPELNEDTSIVSLLRKFVEDVKTLLSSASQAITDLVREGSSFMQSVVTMFSWLPAPVTSVIFAGLIVLLVIGVVSKLWR